MGDVLRPLSLGDQPVDAVFEVIVIAGIRRRVSAVTVRVLP
ncbi:hypothetical protein SAMN05444920_11132 [Nonomuraea solani]|uniref:Uncharacterized protein n=1 Tax=Nonomuraea solani TaxID=1144553 RepID=A0A1H6EIM1_9ACTN|nr:hypothetical protein [Nonomuraea solani]SEG97718.1 hypothetical protein SAMN05444920_11132 [Nonomuraea solani]